MSIPSYRSNYQGQGVGQGLPTSRFTSAPAGTTASSTATTGTTPTRQASSTTTTTSAIGQANSTSTSLNNLTASAVASNLQSSGNTTSFGLRTASSSYPFNSGTTASQPLPPAGLTVAQQEANLDPSDFPALGGTPSTTTSNASSALPSSYASLIGTANSINNNSSSLLSGPMAANGQLPPRDFNNADDFPALNGSSLAGGAGGFMSSNNQLGANNENGAIGSNSTTTNLANGINGLSLLPNAARNLSGSNEQASAAAALQHRANLLGAMNGVVAGPNRTASQAEADKRSFGLKQATTGTQQPTWASSQFTNGALSAAGGAASSPLPPSNSDSSRSPAPPASSAPPGVSSLLAAAAQQSRGAIGSTGGAAGSPLPPPTATSTAASGATSAGSVIPQTPAQQVLFSPADRYGLLGLLHIIKTSDPDLNMLALGNDLTTLGLDLSASDNLFSTFITPWSDSKAASALNIEPEFHLPSCYNVQPPPAQTKIGNFSDETLFFIFYSQPRDAMQEMAAHELYKHNWRYHKELKLWLTKEAGTEPTQKTASYERGSYIIFDPTSWERVRREFVLEFAALESRRA